MYDTDRLTNSFCHICESIAHLLIPSVFLHFKVHHKAKTYFFSSRVFFANQFLRLSSNQNFHFWLKPQNFFFQGIEIWIFVRPQETKILTPAKKQRWSKKGI